MVKKFTIPFASQGDANDIPDALQVDGKVSFTQGFGYDYERPYDDPQAKDIAREDMNGLFKAITSAVGELQTLGASEWSSAISYPKGAIVYYEKDLYISQVDGNQNKPPQNWVSITSIANDSLKKAANLSDLTNKTTARSNLGLGSSATLNKTDVLGTSTSLVATQKLVNDTKINLDNIVRAVDIKSDNAQSTANTAVTKADNAQTRADSAYNLANSKWSPQTTTGTGNIARMSEVEKKVGSYVNNVDIEATYGGCRFLTAPTDQLSPFPTSAHIIHLTTNNNYQAQLGISLGRNRVYARRHASAGWQDSFTLANYEDIPAVTQSTGSSTTSVMSQKAVTDMNANTQRRADEAFELASYSKYRYISVSLEKDITYTNATEYPEFIIFRKGGSGNLFVEIDGNQAFVGVAPEAEMSLGVMINPGSSYKLSGSALVGKTIINRRVE